MYHPGVARVGQLFERICDSRWSWEEQGGDRPKGRWGLG